jgi:hypothetical protein
VPFGDWSLTTVTVLLDADRICPTEVREEFSKTTYSLLLKEVKARTGTVRLPPAMDTVVEGMVKFPTKVKFWLNMANQYELPSPYMPERIP